ncbi:hypothetical protein E3T55_19585 [Cryobacterium frigoriphilum]|uniref:Uncharacterized protein n=1 Tax=Cryobacterium frigoriphilum TaxID=1259150 RepID=A0A4R8ZT86_9MICO|nr:hypothetical protein [Cryobacterium frigoriphilum]TFD44998.1 hypothetical protein E3T55_19585 [Cryobacterium frigoriphilum]
MPEQPIRPGVHFLLREDQGTHAELAQLITAWIGGKQTTARIVVHQKSVLYDLYEISPFLKRVAAQKGTHFYSHGGGPLVILWPTDEVLDSSDQHMTGKLSTLVVTWSEDAAEMGWLRKHHAVDLVTRETLKPLESVLSPVVEVGMRYLIEPYVRGNGFGSYPGKNKAVDAFRAFKRAGITIEPKLLVEFLVGNGASISDARELADYAARVAAGRAIQTKHGGGFRDDILDVWRAQIENAEADID